MKTIVVSAVNLRKGGTLTILNDCLRAFSQWNSRDENRVVAVVHKKELALYDHIEYVEIPWSIRSWFHRLWCEYMTMHKLSKQLGDVYLWLSLHDTTPRVRAERQAVYCHNSYPFFRWHWRHLLLNYRIVCFALFTKLIYRINIHRNRYLIVQQEWFRKEMHRMFGIDRDKIIVARPRGMEAANSSKATGRRVSGNLFTLHSSLKSFLYPAFPDVHKNLECLCEAARLLEQEVGTGRFEVVLTTNKDSNKYSKWISKRWGDVQSLRFSGFLDKKELEKEYAKARCLVFPSKVETWGLPISEFASTGKPMLLADLPYAHETAAGSQCVAFFNPEDAAELKDKMLQVLEDDYRDFHPVAEQEYEKPYTDNWQQTIETLIT